MPSSQRDRLESGCALVGGLVLSAYNVLVYALFLGEVGFSLRLIPILLVLPITGALLSWPFAKSAGFGERTVEERVLGEDTSSDGGRGL
jgi:hypothetical protein